MRLLERYEAGEHLAVYDELVARRAQGPEALAVARAMVERIRRNLQLLAPRWQQAGCLLRAPFGLRGTPELERAQQQIHAFEAEIGPLPPTLHVLYEDLGWIDFVDPKWSPGEPWPEPEEIDAVSFLPLDASSSDDAIVLWDDPLIKVGIGGVGPLYVPLPVEEAFDPVVYFEDEPIHFAFRDGAGGFAHSDDPIRPIGYLRQCIVEQGGIGMGGSPERVLDDELLAGLTRGLVPF